MASKDTLFTVAGITTHAGADSAGTKSERTKVRYGTDLIRLIKMLNNPKKIEDKRLGICLAPVRVDLVELPAPMAKLAALTYLATHPEFQSAADQSAIQDEISDRSPKIAKAKKEKTAKVTTDKKSMPSLDSIKNRVKKTVTVEQILAVATPLTIAE